MNLVKKAQFFLFFLPLVVMNFAWADELEIYSNGEKPFLSQPLSADAAAALRLDLPRDGNATVTVRLPTPGHGKLMSLLKASLILKDAAKHTATLRSYVVGVHYFPKSSFKRGSAGEMTDILVPEALARSPGFKIPVANIPSRPIYVFDVHAGVSAKPGLYEGDITFETNDEKYSFPLKIRIYSTLLPKKFKLRTTFGYAPWTVLLKHYGAWNSEELKLYRKYFEIASDHRVDLHKIYLSLPDKPDSGDLLLAGGKGQSFMDLWKSVESGDLSTEGYRWSTTDLPIPETMKYPSTRPVSEHAVIKKYWQALNQSVKQHGLQKDVFVYFVDEPKPETFPMLAASLKLIRPWAPDLKFLVTTHHKPILEGAFNIWCINLIEWDVPKLPRPEFYAARQAKGDELWFYVSCNSNGCSGPDDVHLPDLITDRPSAFLRVLPWMALRYKATGILHYDTVYGYNAGPDSPWKDPFQFTGYGEGNLYYPCKPQVCGTKEHEVLPSFRFKTLRDGLEDAQLLAMARDKGLPVDQWIKELIPSVRQFPSDTAAYEKIKVRALEALEAQ